MSFEIVDLSDASTCERSLKQKVLNSSGNIEITWEFVQKAIAVAQGSLSKQADKY